MAFFFQETSFHSGEEQMHKTMKVDMRDNPTVPALSPQLAAHLRIAPLIAIGTVDRHGRPWTTLWGGEPGLAQSLGGGVAGIRTVIGAKYDPVVEELFGREVTGEVVREQDPGRMISGLTLDLEKRKRVKLFGRMVAGATSMREDEVLDETQSAVEVQLVVKIEQSLGNCPKYLNAKRVEPRSSRPVLLSESSILTPAAMEMVKRADMFLMSSRGPENDMDTNYRGGPPGFTRILSNGENGAVLVYPEYSGNRLYQSLGNLAVDSRVGLCFPDFETGDMLYVSGNATVSTGVEASSILPRSNLIVKIECIAARHVHNLLPFRGAPLEDSPYNPKVRYLTSEKAPIASSQDSGLDMITTLLAQQSLSPTISRFRFRVSDIPTNQRDKALYRPGQYVTFDFAPHLNMGYSHMRDDDPLSINDDFVRTFTVSSNPGTLSRFDEFEIVIRKVGPATSFLFRHDGNHNHRQGDLQLQIKGFGGEFQVAQSTETERIAFIAAGVGITPLLSCLDDLDTSRLAVLWSIRKDDLSFVGDIITRHPSFAKALTVFLSLTDTNSEEKKAIDEFRKRHVKIETRRIMRQDIERLREVVRFYLCTSPSMRTSLLGWLEGKEVVYEDFNF